MEPYARRLQAIRAHEGLPAASGEMPEPLERGRRPARKAIKMHPSEPQLGRVLHCQTKTLQEGSLVIIKSLEK